MKPRTVRSRGCNECRQRRVKCDETATFCKQCMRMGLLCSGPVQGAMILDMTKGVARKSDKSRIEKRGGGRNSSVASQKGIPANVGDGLLSPLECKFLQCDATGDDDGSQGLSAEALHLELDRPELYQSYNSDTFEQVFISRFIELVTSIRPYQHPIRPRSWLFEVPALLYTSHRTAIKYSVRAAAMAHCGFLLKNESIRADSLRWYIAGLESQRKLLETPTWDESHRVLTSSNIPDHETMCAPLMLTCFELLACTTPDGWVQHLTAASKLLEIRGPENCGVGPEHQIFRSLRIFTAFVSIINCKPSFFAQENWCKIPFSYCVKTSWDLLVDILLSIPSRLIGSGNNCKTSIDLFITSVHESVTSYPGIEEETRRLLSELEDWWWSYGNENVIKTEDWASYPNPSSPVDDNFKEPTCSPNFSIYRDTLTANTVSLYNSASLVAYSTLFACQSLNDDEDSPSHEWQMLSHAASILSVAAFQESMEGNYGDLIRTVFPLRIVALLSPSSDQRTVACSTLERWTQVKGLQGLYNF